MHTKTQTNAELPRAIWMYIKNNKSTATEPPEATGGGGGGA